MESELDPEKIIGSGRNKKGRPFKVNAKGVIIPQGCGFKTTIYEKDEFKISIDSSKYQRKPTL